jgi:hypothetical protein
MAEPGILEKNGNISIIPRVFNLWRERTMAQYLI